MQIINDFLDNFDRDELSSLNFSQITNHDGAVYPAICQNVPRETKKELFAKIQDQVGFTIIPRYTFLRRNELGAPEPYQAHSDVNMGDYTCIVYVQGDGGTAFVKHKETGMIENVGSLYDIWMRDTNDYDAWDVTSFVDLVPNKALLYDANLLHRGEPVEGSGEGDDARTLLICFYDKSLLQRTFDREKIREILTHPDVAADIGVNENPNFDIPIDDNHHYLLMDGGLFILHKVEEGWQMHVNVLKASRDKAKEGANQMLSYAFNQLGAQKVVCYIPKEYPNVYNFALSFNMNDHGFNGGDHYLSLGCDQWDMSEIKPE